MDDILLKKALKVTCKHLDKYNRPYHNFCWSNCEDCKLRHIIYNPLEHIVSRDYCFAIWHEGILE